MKKTIALAAMLLAASQVFAQVNITRTGGTGYILQTTQGDTLHLRGATPVYNSYHTAYMDALNWSGENYGEEVHVVPTIVDRVRADFGWFDDPEIIEIPGDTVYVPADTIHFASTEMLQVNDSIVQPRNGWEVYDLHITVNALADLVRFEYYCGEVQVAEYTETMLNDSTFTTSLPMDCTAEAWYRVTAEKQVEPTRKKMAIHEENLNIETLLEIEDEPEANGQIYHTDFTDYDPEEWVNTWGELEWWVEDSTLHINIDPRSISRLQWNRVPEHTNAKFHIVEELHESHGTGVHAGLRTSEVDRQHAAELYIHGPGLGVSFFVDGGWTNPVTYPFEWQPSDVVEHELWVQDGQYFARVWKQGEEPPAEWQEYTGPEVAAIPAGRFAIGSTGAGLYLIREITVTVLD